MLSALKPWDPHKPLVDILCDYAPYFKMYFDYCNNYNNLMTTITKLSKEKTKLADKI